MLGQRQDRLKRRGRTGVRAGGGRRGQTKEGDGDGVVMEEVRLR